jgi:hypothetical protein
MPSRNLKFRLAGLTALCIFLSVPITKAPATAAEGKHSKELGFVDYYAGYADKSKKGKRMHADIYEGIKEGLNMPAEMVTPNIFLPANKEACNAYKRIYIPCATDYFTIKMYESMVEYVKEGGLLITNSSLTLLDANENYTVDSEDKATTWPRDNIVGIGGSAGALFDKVCVTNACPLTEGLTTGEWLSINKVGGRRTVKTKAEVVMVSNAMQGEAALADQPFLSYRQLGEGCCIYLVGQLDGSMKNAKDDNVFLKIIKNIFSTKTLKWLCAGDE